jgi:hypothetical protein
LTFSREIVDGDRPNLRAIDRRDSPPARPREISSRSANDNRNGERLRTGTGGRSIARRLLRTALCARSISLPLSRAGHPCAAKSAIRHFSNSDNRSTTHLPIGSNAIEGRDAMTPETASEPSSSVALSASRSA